MDKDRYLFSSNYHDFVRKRDDEIDRQMEIGKPKKCIFGNVESSQTEANCMMSHVRLVWRWIGYDDNLSL